MRVRDGQRDFTGGMVDRIAPERLAENQYASGKNVEIRYGGVRSRRGSWLLIPNATDSAGTECEVMGAEIFRYPEPGVADDLVQAIYRPDVDETRIYAVDMPSIGIRAQLTLPAALVGRQPIRMVQAYDRLYILRDGAVGWRWDAGNVDNPVTQVANGLSGPMPTAREGLFAFNRLWLVEGDDTVIPSDLLEENWDRVDNEFRVEQGDGTRLVALRQFGGGSLLAFKERGVALIRSAFNFTDASDLAIEFISSSVGAVAADTVVNVGADVFFLGHEGVWTVRQTTEQNAQLVEVPLSEPIAGLVNDINWRFAAGCTAVVFDNYYLLAVPVGGATVPNRLLVYDLLLKTWVGFWEYNEAQAEDTDGLWRHFALRKARKGLRDELISVGAYGACGMLCKGDYKDWVTSEAIYIDNDSGSDLIPFTDSVATVYGGSMATHLSGTISCTIKEESGLINGLISFNPVLIQFTQASSSDPVTVFARGVGAGGVMQWELTFDTTLLSDGGWHTVSLTQLAYGFGPYFQIDGVTPTESITVGASLDAWVGSNGIPGYPSFIGLLIPTSGHISSLSIEAHPNCYATLTDFLRVELPFEEGSGSTSVVNRIFLGGGSQAVAMTLSGSAVWGADNNGASDANITSELVTRGMVFGDLFAAKSGLRGECRFAHGQPSVTCVMSSDIPFDTETLASLNAKTYSLTDYEVAGRTAWTASNANNDFQTPFREDYAPIALGVQMGADGLVLDKHREHTELFSSLAIFGWTQFTLTNTQGFIRYNGLSLQAQDRNTEQDTGNNGY